MKIEKLSLLAGTDIYIPIFDTILKQPKIKDIALLGEQEMFQVATIFEAADRERIIKIKLEDYPEEERQKIEVQLNYTIATDYDAFIQLLDNRLEILTNSFMALLFPALVDAKWIRISDTRKIWQLSFNEERDSSPRVYQVSPEMFSELKEIVNQLFFYKTEEDKDNEIKPAGAMAQSIADKIAKAKAKRAKMYGKSENEDDSVLSTMVSVLAIGGGIPLLEVLNMTFVQVIIQLNRSQLFESYRTQIQLGAFVGIDGDIVDWRKPL